jgi:hypothetical protein
MARRADFHMAKKFKLMTVSEHISEPHVVFSIYLIENIPFSREDNLQQTPVVTHIHPIHTQSFGAQTAQSSAVPSCTVVSRVNVMEDSVVVKEEDIDLF